MYYARRLDDGTVLRISVSRATAGVLALGMFQPFVLVLLAALVFSGVLARRLSKHIVEPLNQLDLEHPLENNAYEELSPLLGRINRQHLEIRRQMQLLKQRTDEFAQIIASMQRGTGAAGRARHGAEHQLGGSGALSMRTTAASVRTS